MLILNSDFDMKNDYVIAYQSSIMGQLLFMVDSFNLTYISLHIVVINWPVALYHDYGPDMYNSTNCVR